MQIACAQLVYQARPSLTFLKSATSAQYSRTWPLKMAQLGRNWYAKSVVYQYDENEASQRLSLFCDKKVWSEQFAEELMRKCSGLGEANFVWFTATHEHSN